MTGTTRRALLQVLAAVTAALRLGAAGPPVSVARAAPEEPPDEETVEAPSVSREWAAAVAGGGSVEDVAWSGWYWPTSAEFGPTLFAPNGPLAKYDRYVLAVTGEDPQTRLWEQREVNFPGIAWAGHCNGSAAAALLEEEPTAPIEVAGIRFSVGDLKGLLAEYHFADAAAWSLGDGVTLDAADFHLAVARWIERRGRGYIVTFNPGGEELWNYPAYAAESSWEPEPGEEGRWHVRTTLWMADMETRTEYVGVLPWPGPNGKTLTYDVWGDPRRPDRGTWTGVSAGRGFARPTVVWFPDPLLRNALPFDEPRVLTSPAFERRYLDAILAGREPEPPPEREPDATPE